MYQPYFSPILCNIKDFDCYLKALIVIVVRYVTYEVCTFLLIKQNAKVLIRLPVFL